MKKIKDFDIDKESKKLERLSKELDDLLKNMVV